MMMSVKDFSLRQHHSESLRACSGEDLLSNDRISDLPDDILVRILSLLTLKEFGSTIVLSKRWRHVWAYVPSLKFDPGTMQLYKLRRGSTKEELEEEELKYFYWVEQVVNSHKAYTIDEFTIRYEVHGSRKDNIDNWLKFAMEKRVKRLQLNIKSFGKTCREIPYTLPSLSPSTTLISLQLDGVNVSREVLEKLLSDCQALESLSVSITEAIAELKVAGPSLKLKYLKLYFIIKLKHLEISAPNLISFHYTGQVINWPLISCPKLTKITILGPYGLHMNNNFLEHSNISSQIESLTLSGVPFETNLLSGVFPVFRKLKTLDIKFYPRSDVELFRLSTIIESCPLLHKVALEPLHIKKLQRTKETRNFRPFRHKHLKIFEYRGFVGYDVDIAFILYLTNGAVLAEKLTVFPESSIQPHRAESQLIAEKEAEHLRTIIKPGLELEIGERPKLSLYY